MTGKLYFKKEMKVLVVLQGRQKLELVGPKTLALQGGSMGEAKIKESAKKATEGTLGEWKQVSCCSEFSEGAAKHAQNVGKDFLLQENR